jgi:hypothetical protein
MTNTQLIGIAVAVVILLILIIALIVTRGKGKTSAAKSPVTPAVVGSFLDEPLRNDFDKLGRAAAPAGRPDASEAPGESAPAGVPPVVETGPAEEPAPLREPTHVEEPTTVTEATAYEAPTLTPVDDAAIAEAMTQPAPVEEPGEEPAPESAAEPAEAEPLPIAAEATEAPAEEAPAEEAPPEEAPAPSGEKGVPLSDIIVTTNQQTVDLGDPDVRRLVKDLIEDEIELAQQYKEQGQILDAVLQLTEAEKACNALGLTSKARLIRAMIKELNA